MRLYIARLFALILPLTAPAAVSSQAPDPLPLSETSYELDLAIDYVEERLDGRARITLENRGSSAVAEVPLLLYRTMTVDAALDGEGGALAFEQDVVGYEEVPSWQVNAVTVRLATPLAPGAGTTLVVAYGGWLFGYPEIMRYTRDRIDPDFTIIRMDTYAYPVIGVPSLAVQRASPLPSYEYAARVRVPSTVSSSTEGRAPGDRNAAEDGATFAPVVANGGRLVSREADSSGVVWTYESLRPSWRMDFAIADYGILESGGDRVYWLPGDSTGAVRVLGALAEARRLYADWFGPLVQETGYAVIEIPDGMGSQADVTSVIQTAAAFRDPARLREVYHEVAHLWHPTPTDPQPPRWNEGMASFLEYLLADRLDEHGVLAARVDAVLEWLGERLGSDDALRQTPMAEYGQRRMTDLSYSVGMVMFDLLYQVLGREDFGRIVGEHYRRYVRSGAATQDFVALATEVGGAPAARILDEWLRTTAWTRLVAQGMSRSELVDRYATGPP